ncbi:MAG: chloride channel protein [Bacteroidales bacterium]|nr:chloride channel protein [Bacteroidales bacterium]MBQ5748307.1 chloride channel protein [Bacteroidales bacterium]
MMIRWSSLTGWIKRQPEQRMLMILALVVGIGSGLAAVILKQLAHLIDAGLTNWIDSSYDNIFLLLFPGVGMLLSLLFVRYFIKDDIGHGVTKALFAISKNNSRIKPHNTWSSVLASSVTIGFGGSVGAEAPIVYTGAAIGSNVARKLGLSYKTMTILLGCGASGAVAGIFKAPMAGILFTLEILLFNISMSSMLPLLISTISATTVSYLLLGNEVAFASVVDNFSMGNFPYYLILGVACGFCSLYFIRMTMYLEDRIKKISNPFKRWAYCALGLGILIYLFPPLFGEGYSSLGHMLQGNPDNILEYSLFSDILKNYKWVVPVYFIFVLVFKVFAMSFTNAGGGVGGTFGPTLIVGGIAGFIIARTINLTGIHPLPEANFALVGMAGLMSGVMQAPMTAIFLIAEITGGYALLMPLIIVSITSLMTIRIFEPYSIYSKRLAKTGDLITHDGDKAVLTLLNTSELIERDFMTVGPEQSLRQLVDVVAKSKRNIYPVVDKNDKLQGTIFLDDIREVMFKTELYDELYVCSLMKECEDTVCDTDRMDIVMDKFDRTGAWNLPVVDILGRYLGFVSKSKIFSSYRSRLQDVSHD